MGYIVGPFISVPAQNSATWTQRTADISDYIGQNVRLVVLYQSGSSYTGDVQLDDFNIGGNTFDPENGANGFQVQSVEDNSQLSNVNLIQSDYDAVTWVDLTTDSVTHQTGDYGKFFRDSGGTPSGGTGNTSGNTGSFYYFAETSGTGSDNDIWLRSPEVVINDSTLSLYTAQNGATSGPIYVYLELNDAEPAQAIYGLGHYGQASYGEIPVYARAPLSVSTSGAIYGSATYGSNTYGGSITETHSGVSFTGSVTTVTVTADNNVFLPSTSATGSVTTATIVGDANLSLTGVSASGTTDPDVVITADATHTVTSVQGTSATGTVGTVGVAIHQVDGVKGTGKTTTATISGDSLVAVSTAKIESFVNTVTTTADSNTSVTGVEATGAVGDAESLVNITAAVTGVEATATAGDVDVFTGTFVTVPVTGLEATGSVTTATVTADAVADNLTGLEATSTVNDTLVFIGDANFTLPNTEATGQTTTATVAADANTTTGSVQATATADPDVVIEGDALHTITSVQGVSATGGVGDVVAGANIDSVTGVEATGQVATATTSGSSNTTPESAEGTSQTTTAIVSADANLAVTGVEGTGEVTTVDISIPKNVDVTGVEATGIVTTTTIFGDNNVTSPSVSANATVDPDVVIEGDALHTITSVQGVSATGGIGDVTAEANIDVVEGVEATASVTTVVAIAKATASVSGVEGTSAVNDVTVSATNVIVVDFVTGQILANTATVSGDANLELTSVEATPELTTPIVNASAVAVSPAIEIDSTLGTLTVAGTVFDYEAQKENYSKRRTVYLPRAA